MRGTVTESARSAPVSYREAFETFKGKREALRAKQLGWKPGSTSYQKYEAQTSYLTSCRSVYVAVKTDE